MEGNYQIGEGQKIAMVNKSDCLTMLAQRTVTYTVPSCQPSLRWYLLRQIGYVVDHTSTALY